MTLNELLQQRKYVTEQMRALASNKKVSAADVQRFDSLANEAEDLAAEIVKLEGERSRIASMPANEHELEYRQAFRSYLRSGPEGLTDRQRRTLGRVERRDGLQIGGGNSLQGTGGGYLVPIEFERRVEEAMLYSGPMMRVSTIIDTDSGAPMPYPNDNDTATMASEVAETVQTVDADVPLGSVVLNGWKYSSGMIKVSNEFLQDSGIDLDEYFAKKFATRFARVLNLRFTTGSGANQPLGFMNTAISGCVATGAASNDGGSETGSTSIGSDDLVELEHSVDTVYREMGACYMMHDLTLKMIKKVKDKQGRPVWMPPLSEGSRQTVNGYPVEVNNSMPQVAANAKPVAFGCFQKYIVRRVKSVAVKRFPLRFVDYGQVGFVAFSRWDGLLVDAGTHPVKFMTMAAS